MKCRSSTPSSITSTEQVFTFGKHKGYSVEYVLQDDPDYFLWLHDEHICKVSKEILDMADAYSEEKRFCEAMDGEFDWMDEPF